VAHHANSRERSARRTLFMKTHHKPTVVSWCNAEYRHLADGLRSDCDRLGYVFHLYEIESHYASLVEAWCNHPRIIRRGVLDHGLILFLDVECRMVRPLPAHWQAPLAAVRKPAQPFWITFNTGTVMADESSLPWLDAWIRIIERWDMKSLPSEAYILWPNDVCDELAFHAAVAALGVEVQRVELEYKDRSSPAEVVRGLWKNEHTIIQHPTLHHWPKVTDPEEAKKLFVQNYAGLPEEAEAVFSVKQGIVQRHGWTFDTDQQLYAPTELFQNNARAWKERKVQLTSAQY